MDNSLVGEISFLASCAILARLAHESGDEALLFQVGYSLLQAKAQSDRAKQRRSKDALTELIEMHLAVDAGISAADLWRDLCDQATGFDDVLVDYDTDRDELEFVPSPGAGQKRINRTAFIRRADRVREKLVAR